MSVLMVVQTEPSKETTMLNTSEKIIKHKTGLGCSYFLAVIWSAAAECTDLYFRAFCPRFEQPTHDLNRIFRGCFRTLLKHELVDKRSEVVLDQPTVKKRNPQPLRLAFLVPASMKSHQAPTIRASNKGETFRSTGCQRLQIDQRLRLLQSS